MTNSNLDNEISPLAIVESIAQEFALEARRRRVQINGFCVPELPLRIRADDKLLCKILRALTSDSLKAVENQKDGAVLVEALLDKSLVRTSIRFGVSHSRTDWPIEEVEKRAQHFSAELNADLKVDKELIGRSTRIYFDVPMKRAQVTESEPLLPPEVRDLRVFLVANDPNPNRLIQYYCRHAGISFDGAPTAAESIVELGRANHTHPFDVLMVAPPIEDLSPDKIAKTIRESDLAATKMIYVAPFDDPEDRLAHMQAGYDDTIAKPLTKRELFASLRRMAGRIPKKTAKAPLILVVEDNAVNAQIAAFQLRAIGFDSEIVTNGKEALDAVERGSFAAVLMDLQMPVMDGLEATRRIRAREAKENLPRLPIIALTANPEWKDQALEAGCDCFLTKPIKKETLRVHMGECLKAA